MTHTQLSTFSFSCYLMSQCVFQKLNLNTSARRRVEKNQAVLFTGTQARNKTFAALGQHD